MNPNDIELIYELSPMQQAMLFHSLLTPGSGVYVIQMSLRLTGRLHLPAFERAWRHLLQRHGILRTAFFFEGLEKPLQVVYKRVDLPVRRESWRGIAADEQEARLRGFLEAERERGFDLTEAPLMRLSLFEREPGVHQMVWTIHHLLVDGWSQGQLLRELFAGYAAFSQGQEPRLAPAGSFRDYIGWLQRQDAGTAEAFWRKCLAGFDTPTLLAGAEGTSGGSTWRAARRRDLSVPAATTTALREAARRHRLTLNTLVQGAWSLLLAQETGRRDVVFGTTVAGRPADLPGVESTLGLFINSQPVRVAVPPAARLWDWLRALQERQVEMRRFEHAPLVDVQRWSDLPAGVPLFDHLLVFENVALPAELARPVADLEIAEDAAHDLTNYPLNVIVIPGHEMLLTIRWDAARFETPHAARLLERLARLLAAFAEVRDGQDTPALGDLPLLLDGERHQAVAEWNDTGREVETGVTLHGLIARQAGSTPGATAVSFDGSELTYRELEHRAGALARHLAGLGVEPDGRVGVLMERSLEMIVALLGTLEAGAAYVPLDPSWPAERLAVLVESSGARVVLAQERLRGLLPGRGETAVFLDRPDQLPPRPAGWEGVGEGGRGGEGLAYVLFTSGSTGTPKGVMIPHRGIVNRLLWMQEAYGLTPEDRVLQKTPFSFDVSVWEFFWPLLTGARLVFAKPEGHKDPSYLAELIAREKITTLHFVPSMLQAFLEAPGLAKLTSVRRVMASGEALTPELVRRFFQRLPHAELHNLYGPTEASVDVSFWPCVPEPPRSLVPIGRPIANLRLLVMDQGFHPLPIGVAGELLLGGVGLARGYLGRPDLTAAAFVPDPSGVEPGGRLYRTGDLTRLLPDGNVEYLGRIDFQVKIRGFRIELGEIEAVLAGHPAVRECVVLARQDVPGDPRLVAYAVLHAAVDDPRAVFSAHLRTRLPEYMVPAAFVVLDAFLLTTSGKVDRKALPAPERPGVDAGSVAPADAAEELLAAAWAEVLRLPRVGARDDFFALGGHSLLATQVASRVREAFGVEIPLRHLFEAPTVAGLAERIDAQAEALAGGGDLGALLTVLEGLSDAEAHGRVEDPRALRVLASVLAPPAGEAVPVAPLPRASRESGGVFPLSFAQQRLWFIDQLEPASPAYNIPLPVRLRGELPIALLARIATAITRRHETLRTTFAGGEGAAVQVVHPPEAALVLPVVDLSGLPGPSDRTDRSDRSDPSDSSAPAATAEIVAREIARAEALRPFDLRTGPLLRLTLVRQATDDHLLLITLHHVIADGWSMRVLLGEVAALFEAFAAGRPSPLPDLPFQYADFAVWQRRWLQGGVLEEQLAFWKERLAGAPQVLDLPTDRPRPAVQSYRGAAVGREVEPAVAAAVRELCRREDVTPFMAFLAAWAVLLGRHAGQDDLLIGTPVAGRHTRGTEHLIGFFANTLVLRTGLAGSFRDLLGRVRQTALDAFTHQDLPFERLVEELVPERDLSRAPLFQAMFVLQNAAGGGWRMPGLTIEPVEVAGATAKFDLLLNVTEGDGGFTGTLEFSTDLFDAARMDRLLRHLDVLLAGAAADPERAVAELPLLTAEERDRVLFEWNGDAVAWPAVVVHGPVEEQVARTPEAEAVVWAGEGGGALTYAAVNRRANQLAHHLRALGVGPDDRVSISLERSLDLPVAVLGVLKAGAAYVPVDPDYPAERVAFMLADSRSRALVTTADVAARLPEPGEGTRVVRLDADRGLLAARPDTNPACWSRPETLAYVIYTSGSTGRPKGVAMPHGVLSNLLHWQCRASAAGPGSRTLQHSSLSFDVSFLEILSTWWTGGTLVTLPQETRRDAVALLALLRGQRVTRLFLPFVALQQIAEVIEHGAPFPEDLREILTAGEQLRITGQIAAWLERSPVTCLENQYGPSEGHVVTVHRLAGAPAAWPALPPIGRPLPNVRLFLLDRHLALVPQGVPGHLCFGGAQVVRGYLGRPELTAEKFLPDPWSPEPGARLYATGDLARYLADGTIQYLGRIDQQVKIRGFRIEPGEVEAALSRHPDVREAAVVVRGEGVRMRLVGYWVSADPLLTSGALRDFLGAELPEYMVPAALVRLDALPLTPSGKVDRKALPEPAEAAVEKPGAEDAPADPVEELLAGIWAEVLGRGRVGVRESFFLLGGHSLLATQVISRVRGVLGVEIPLRQLFETPTVEGFAKAVRAAGARGTVGAPPLTPMPREGDPPVSFAQQRLWLIDQLDPGSPAYDIPLTVRLEGEVDPGLLERVFAEIVRRHEVLRTTFAARGAGAVQVVHPPQASLVVPLVDLSGLPGLSDRTDPSDRSDPSDSVQARQARALALREARFSFDLRRGPLLRLVLVRLGARDHLLLLTFHHIVTDGWSMGVLLREVAALHEAFSRGLPSPLPELPLQYADFAIWQRSWLQGEVLEAQLGYWKGRLAGAPQVLALPTDRPRPAVRTFRGAARTLEIDPAVSEAVLALCRRQAVTPFMVLLAVWSLLLGRLAGQDDLIVGTPIAGRNRREIEDLIGFFVNTLALRVELAAEHAAGPTFQELLSRVRETTLDAFAHQDLPFERLVEELVPRRDLSRTPLFQVLFALQNTAGEPRRIPGLSLRPVELTGETSKFDLSLTVSLGDRGLEGSLEHDTTLFDGSTIARLLARLGALLAGAAAHPGRRLGDLPWLLDAERHQMLVELPDAQSRLAAAAPGEEAGEGPADHLPLVVRLTGELSAETLERAFAELVRRHAVLRAPLAPEGEGLPGLSLLDLSDAPEEAAEEWARELLAEEVRHPFDLARGPLLRLGLIRLAEQEHLLAVTLHRSVADARSLDVLLRETGALYTAFAAGEPSPLPELPAPPGGAVRRQRDRPRGHRGAACGVHLPARLSEGLRALGRRCGVTPFVVLLSAWSAVLGRLAAQDEILVGTPVSGRDEPGTQDLIGPFAEVLAVRAGLAEARTFAGLLARVDASHRDALAHREPRPPLVQATFELHAAAPELPALPGLVLTRVPVATAAVRYELQLTLADGEDGFAGTLEYSTGLFDPESAGTLVRRFVLLLEGAVAAPEASLETLPFLFPEEREQALHTWNDTARPYPRDASLAGRFEQVAREHPEAPALITEDGAVWTFRKLDEASRRLARRLRALGVGPESAVGLCLERSPELILGTLAIVRAGGHYVPLDAAYPGDRLRFMLEDTGASLVLVHAATRERIAALAPPTLLSLDEEPAATDDPGPGCPYPPAESLACVIYTSGSTGRPKGVAVTQRAVVRLVCGTDFVHLGPGDRTGHVASISFDAATYEIWGALLTGAAVVILSRETVLDPSSFAAALAERRVTSMFLTSALFTRMAAEQPEAFQHMSELLVGGEAVDPGAARRVLAGKPPRRLLNGYGPTESTTFAAWHHIREVPADAALVPIGQPVAQTTLWVLDRGLEPVPPGTAGELHLGGDGLARGYLRRPELTAAAFVPHPWGDGERLYKTGDLARRRPDGPVELLGRLDDQVKIRGFRIEPGEIEAVLAGHPDVRAGAVVARREEGETGLVAYVVLAPEAAGGRARTALRAWLQERLPDSMVPAAWVILPALPLTANGKVDRRALPAPREDDVVRGGAFVAPSGPLEESLAAIWAEVLRRGRIGALDDFFALGGHSMLATQVATRVREVLGLEMPLRLLFEAPTVRQLARSLREAPPVAAVPEEAVEPAPEALPPEPLPAVSPRRALTLRLLALSPEKRELLDAVLREKNAEPSATGAAILPREDREAPVPLSFSQERMWFLHLLDPKSAVYNVYLGVRLSGALQPALLAACFAELARRHQILATRYEMADADGSRPVQVMDPATVSGLPSADLSALPPEARAAELERLQAAESGRPFDLVHGPVMRTTLVHLSPFQGQGGEAVLLLNVHHIAIDGWSLGLLLNELAALYEALSTGEPLPAPASRLQYADFAVWQRAWMQGEVLEAQRSFWRRELDPPLPLLALPTDRPRQVPQPFRLATETVALPAGLTADLHALGAGRGASLFMVLLSALAAVLHRTGGDERLLVGTPVAGRNRRELEGLVGMFLNTLILRVDLDGDPGFGTLLQATAHRALEAFAHQDLPLETLLQELRLDGAGSAGARGPFQVMLLVQNLRRWEIEVPGLTLAGLTAEREVDLGTTVFELGLTVEEHAGALHAALSYNAALFDGSTLQRLLGHLGTLLAGAVADPGTRLSDLPLLTAAEQEEVRTWNPQLTAAPGSGDLIPALFAAQAARTPNAEAVRQSTRSLTYAELEQASRALAGRLRALGAGPEVPVAVFLERSPELIAALLGVLRAGSVYAPLDPAFPPERLAWILDDLKPRVLLTDRALAGKIAWEGSVLLVDEPEEPAPCISFPPPAPEQGAYVIYTSGSTGRPKGVVVPHGALAAFVAAARQLYGITAQDRVLQLASVGFDASVEEIYPCLTTGGTLVLRTDEMAATLAGFLQGCVDQGVTVLDLPTAFWHELVASPELEERGAPPAVRVVILGGERPLPERVASWLRKTDPRLRLFNTYGPTEATVVATAAELALDQIDSLWREVSMGRPLPGTQAHVADRSLRPVPIGVPGELLLGGLGVARGYLGRPDLTAERFVPDPFSGVPGARLYRTGDLARRRVDGSLEFAGRVDQQVKIRGFRVEPGEIETVLATHPQVGECAVVARKDGPREGGLRLVAYVVPAPGTRPTVADLRTWLESRLPAWMVPAAFVSLSALPRTPTGKIDRRALPAPDGAQLDTGRPHVAPRNEFEEIIAEIWSEALGVERLSVFDSFFELGGNSLLLLQIMRRLREAFDLEVPLRAIFEERTVAALAKKVEELLIEEIRKM